MRPDGVLPESKEKKRARPQRPRRKSGLRWRVLELLNAVRATFGLRRRPKSKRYEHTVEDASPAPVADDDPQAFQRVSRHVLRALAFGLLVFVALSVYGLLERRPPDLDALATRDLVAKAVAELDAGDVAGARKLRDQAQTQGKRDPALFMLDGHLAAAEGGEAAEAVKRLSQALPGHRQSVKDLITVAGYCLATQDADGALEALARAAEAQPQNRDLRLLNAANLLALGKFERAVTEANAYEELGGIVPVACDIRGQAYLALDQPVLARRELESVLGYTGAPNRVRMSLADALTRLDESAKALKYIGLVLENEPDNADAHLALGIVMEKIGEYGQAEVAYRRAVELAPRHVKALNNLAYLLAERQGHPAEALPFAERARELAPSTPAVLDTLGWTYRLLERHGEALPLIERAASLAPNDPDIQLHLGDALVRAGRHAEAKDILTKLATSEYDTAIRERARKLLRPIAG